MDNGVMLRHFFCSCTTSSDCVACNQIGVTIVRAYMEMICNDAY